MTLTEAIPNTNLDNFSFLKADSGGSVEDSGGVPHATLARFVVPAGKHGASVCQKECVIASYCCCHHCEL
ncbi:hypothetical protein E2C01_017700 [Portunus trituberculatus]|uniref:Uncharacterized protein n=1 Tax=Portunus trituberculatus TaxID=210409 RepID=A0A5B7DUI8_PORTR|nr:hypothetical protein [Portunus trituberculatus]